MSLRFDVAGSQINGDREYQEDELHFAPLVGDNGFLAIVADGMGGHASGNLASKIVIQTFNKHFTSHYPSSDTPGLLRESLLQANQAITEGVKETPGLEGMGCTFVAALVENNNLYWISVGDSHLYVIRDGVLEKKNKEHTYASSDANGAIPRNILYSAVTGEKIEEIDCSELPAILSPGDRIVIASDGLNTLPDSEIADNCTLASSAKQSVEILLQCVKDANKKRQDNTTVIVVRLEDSEAKKPAQTSATPTYDSSGTKTPAGNNIFSIPQENTVRASSGNPFKSRSLTKSTPGRSTQPRIMADEPKKSVASIIMKSLAIGVICAFLLVVLTPTQYRPTAVNDWLNNLLGTGETSVIPKTTSAPAAATVPPATTPVPPPVKASSAGAKHQRKQEKT